MGKDDKKLFFRMASIFVLFPQSSIGSTFAGIVRKLAEFEEEKKSRNNQLKLFPVNQKDFLTLMG
jgi:hypothetical protein